MLLNVCNWAEWPIQPKCVSFPFPDVMTIYRKEGHRQPPPPLHFVRLPRQCNNLYPEVERNIVWVECLVQEHSTTNPSGLSSAVADDKNKWI